MNGLTVRGKMVVRKIIANVSFCVLCLCLLFAPLISITQSENVFGSEIKIYANISLMEWLTGGEADFYIASDEQSIGQSKHELKYATIDIEKDLKDPNLVYKNQELSKEEQEFRKIQVETAQESSVPFFCIMLALPFLLTLLLCVSFSKAATKSVAKLEKEGANATEIEKAKKNKYLQTEFNAGPFRIHGEVLLMMIVLVLLMFVPTIKDQCPLDDIRFNITWWGYVLLAVSIIPGLVNNKISDSIANDVEKYNLNDPAVVNTMPFWGSYSANNVTVGAVNGIHNNEDHFSSNDAFDSAKTISEYKKLLDAGAITQEEYDRLKEKILFKE